MKKNKNKKIKKKRLITLSMLIAQLLGGRPKDYKIIK
jgi:hypothetical protein